MAVRGKNLHLEHLEDELINMGVEGGEKAIKILKDMKQFLNGTPGQATAVTVKWDGAPAIICGTDPADGQFFVGTKSVFAVTSPKICKSVNDCKALYDGVLSEKLATSYEHLKKCNIKGVLQGDLMFTNDKKTQRIEGKQYITFRPNTITYAVDPGSKLGEQVNKSTLGIVFHTKYEGDTLPDMKSSFKINDDDFKAHQTTWIQKAEYKNIGGVVSLNSNELRTYDAAIRKAEGSIKKSGRILDEIQSGKKTLKLDTEFKKFFNNYIKQGRSIPSVEKAYQDFFAHMGKEYDKAIGKVKTPQAKGKKVDTLMTDYYFLVKNKEQIKMMIAAYMNIMQCKGMIVDKLKKVQQLRLFVDMGNGDYKVTNDEGYVAISGKDAVKLVDRLEFSKLNFTVPKSWG